MRKIKVVQAEGPVLDWLVAQVKGRTWGAVESFLDYHDDGEMNYSTNWSQGGPIIEREGIALWPNGTEPWDASMLNGKCVESGPTPLIAAMRCYVTSRLGETVEVPEELT